VSPTAFALLVLLGLAVGSFGTLVGAGGGFVLTPVLLILYPRDSASTITAISLVVVFFNALSGSLAYARQRRIDYRSGLAFAAATLPGAVAGVLVVSFAPRRVFDILMAIMLAAVAVWLVARRHRSPHAARGQAINRHLRARDGSEYVYRAQVGAGTAVSVAVGFVSSFLGIGGGVLHVPVLIGLLGFPVHVATATSHFVLVNMSAVATATHALKGSFAAPDAITRAVALSLGVVIGAQGGAWASRRVHGDVIRWLLAAALLGLSLRLLLAAA
jgi:uncharacterized membrane protein YfcA